MRIIEALKWALITRPSRPDRSWFFKSDSAPSIGYIPTLLLLGGTILAVFVGLGMLMAGRGWLGLLSFLFLAVWFTRAAHKLESLEGIKDEKL